MKYMIGVMSKNREFFPTAALLEELARRSDCSGIYLSTPYISPLIDNLNPFKTDALFAGQSLKSIDGIVPRVGRSQTQIGLIYLKHFELIGIPTTITSEALFNTRDKFRCYQTLYKISGIKLPKTILINNSYAFERIIERFKFPVVIKIPDSSQGAGTILVPNSRVAEEIIDALALQHHSPVLIQEFLSPSISEMKKEDKKRSDIRVLVVGDQILGAMERIAYKGEWRTNYAQGAICRPYNLDKNVQEQIFKIIERIGIEVAGIDLFPTSEGLYVLEVNACPGWKAFEETYPDIKVAKIIVDYLQQKIQN